LPRAISTSWTRAGFFRSLGSHRGQLKEGFLEIPGRCTKFRRRVGRPFAPKPLEPATPIQIAGKLGGWVWFDDAPTEGNGEIGEALALDKPVPFKGGNSSISAESGNGTCCVETIPRRPRTNR
jgi:hypothetical protein